MRLLGLDYGDTTVGVALSDPTGTIASPLEVIRRQDPANLKQTIVRIRELVNQYQIQTLVLGYPRNMNDTEGPRAQKTEAFRKRLLRDVYKVEVVLWDERLSTRIAEAPLKELGQDRFERKRVIDAMAASVILQNYLDHLKALQEKAQSHEKESVLMEEKQMILYEPTEQLKSVLDVFETLQWKGNTYYLASVDMGEPDPDDPEEDEDSVFIFKTCSEADQEFLVLKEDGTTDFYVTTVLEEEEEAAVIEAFQNMDGDFDLLLDEE